MGRWHLYRDDRLARRRCSIRHAASRDLSRDRYARHGAPATVVSSWRRSGWKILGAGRSLAAKTSLLGGGIMNRRIVTGYLGGLWNTYDCSNKKVRTTEIITVTAGG
jgi:hypothetical protein